MTGESWDERCRVTVGGMLAKRRWQLVRDETEFAERICNEIRQRVQGNWEETRIAIERAATHQYCIVLHGACSERATRRQQRGFIELWEYLFSIALYKTRDDSLAQDIAQKALEKAWRKIPQCREPGSFLNWAALILINEIREYYRSKKRRGKVFGELDRGEPEITESDLGHLEDAEEKQEFDPLWSTPGDAGLKQVMRHETDQELRALITRCVKNRLQQRILVESFLNDKGYKEIAEELGITVGNLHVLRHRALIALRKCDDFIRFIEDELK